MNMLAQHAKAVGNERCPQCAQYYRCRANGVSVAVYNTAGECIGIWDADRWGCACGTWLQGFGHGPFIGPNDGALAAELASGLVEFRRAACVQCERQPYDEADGTFCSQSCRDEATGASEQDTHQAAAIDRHLAARPLRDEVPL